MELVASKHQAEMEKSNKQVEDLQNQLNLMKIELDGSRAECAQYKVTISTQSAQQYVFESEISLLKSKLNASERTSLFCG